MKVIKSDLCFGIAGKAWAAIDERGNILKVISMNAYPYVTAYSEKVLEKANRKRFCRKAQSVADEMNTASFLKHREKSRAELKKLGTVISGVASCGEFVMPYFEQSSILRNCPFCERAHEIPEQVSKGISCPCGAYGQTDEASDAYLFSQEAGEALGLDPYHAIKETERYLDIRDGGVIIEGNGEDSDPIILLWAKIKEKGGLR